MNFNTFSKFTNFIINTYTFVTAVTNGAIKVASNGTTQNRTLVNSLLDQWNFPNIVYLINRIFPINTIVHIIC